MRNQRSTQGTLDPRSGRARRRIGHVNSAKRQPPKTRSIATRHGYTIRSQFNIIGEASEATAIKMMAASLPARARSAQLPPHGQPGQCTPHAAHQVLLELQGAPDLLPAQSKKRTVMSPLPITPHHCNNHPVAERDGQVVGHPVATDALVATSHHSWQKVIQYTSWKTSRPSNSRHQ